MAKFDNLALRSFTYAVVFTSLFVLTLGTVLIALIVGDWVLIKTANSVLAWFVGAFIMLGFLLTLGAGVGVWIWLRGPSSTDPEEAKHDTMDRLLTDMSVIERD